MAVEALLLAFLTLGLQVAKAAWDRSQAESALFLATQAAVRQIVLPIGVQGVQLSPQKAEVAFSSLLASDLPASLARSASWSMSVADRGTRDVHTGYTFRTQGVMSSVTFHEGILGATFAQTLYLDAEVHTTVD